MLEPQWDLKTTGTTARARAALAGHELQVDSVPGQAPGGVSTWQVVVANRVVARGEHQSFTAAKRAAATRARRMAASDG